jgi:histone-lysine N-methyltransferase SETMAR
MFKNGRTSVTDAERSGHPTTATTAQNEDRGRELILQNRRVTVDEIAKQLNISIGSAYSVVHDNLQFHKVCARWVPKELADEHKRMRLDICSRHFVCYREEDDNFLQRIVTGDETLVHHYQPETKWESMQWKHPSSPAAKKDATISRQVDFDHLLGFSRAYSCGLRGTTVTSATYCDMLQGGLKPAIRSERRGRLSEGVLLLHDSAHPHTAARTLQTLRKLKWGVVEHSAHSPDLAPSDFHLFGPLKEALGGRRF